MITFLHGTIAFRQGKEHIKGWEYELCGRFIDGVGPDIPVSALENLQKRCQGDLDIERLPCGTIRMTQLILAHGAESARQQATDLRTLILVTLGLRTNVASVAFA